MAELMWLSGPSSESTHLLWEIFSHSCRLTSKRVRWDLIRSKHVTWLWCSHYLLLENSYKNLFVQARSTFTIYIYYKRCECFFIFVIHFLLQGRRVWRLFGRSVHVKAGTVGISILFYFFLLTRFFFYKNSVFSFHHRYS